MNRSVFRLVLGLGWGASLANPVLVHAADHVEVKVMVETSQIERALLGLELTDEDADHRMVAFFDDRRRSLFARGMTLRARVGEGDHDESTIKIRPADPQTISDDWFSKKGFKCEQDLLAHRRVDSCSLSAERKTSDIEEVLSGDRKPAELFTHDQKKFLKETFQNASWRDVLERLRVYGPALTRIWKVHAVELKSSKLVVEHWKLRGGRQFLELSTRVQSREAVGARRSLAALMKRLRVKASAHQDSKTCAVLRAPGC